MSENIIIKKDKVTIKSLESMKQNGKKVSMLTAYDFTFARILDSGGVDCILVGDSGANVIAGMETTLPLSLEEIIMYARNVKRGIKRAFMVVDMPFGSYQISQSRAVKNAVKIMKETGAEAIKLEGSNDTIIETAKRISQMGIPVMGHLGLTPQSIHQFGEYKVRAKEDEEAKKVLEGAIKLQEAGCFGVVLEKIPAKLSKTITEKLDIITIGIGAGSDVDGQVLVSHDMLGLIKGFQPKFIRKYLNLEDDIRDAVQKYNQDVKQTKFPSQDEQY